MTYSHMGSPTLPSAMLRFTAEFGMGSGGSKALLPPGKLVKTEIIGVRVKIPFESIDFDQPENFYSDPKYSAFATGDSVKACVLRSEI